MKDERTVKPSAVVATCEYILSTSRAHFKSSLPSSEAVAEEGQNLNSEAYVCVGGFAFVSSYISLHIVW